MKKKVVRRRVFEFTSTELVIVQEALARATASARADIKALDGANVETLEPYIAAAHRFEGLQRKIFKGK